MGQSRKGSLTVDSRVWGPRNHRGEVDTLISGVGGLSRWGKKLNVRGTSGRQRGVVEGFLCLGTIRFQGWGKRQVAVSDMID